MFLILIFLFALIAAYIINKTSKSKMKLSNIPENVLFFYSMDNCPYCEIMENLLENINIEIFKINLKTDFSIEYSTDNTEYKRLSKEISLDGYPTLVFNNSVKVGSMSEEELKKFLNINL